MAKQVFTTGQVPTAADFNSLAQDANLAATGGTIDGVPIGGTTASTGAFTKVSAATGAITTSQPALAATQTWNAAGITFTGLQLNVTDTASAAASLLADFQVGGVSKFKVGKDGFITIGLACPIQISSSGSGPAITLQSNSSQGNFRLLNSAVNAWVGLSALWVGIDSTNALRWGNFGGESFDLTLFRDAANTLAQRNSTAAQTFRLYNTYTDASNYTRLSVGFAANNCSIKPENAGTGSAANLLISGLPTSNPGPGILWNNLGIVNVGT